MIMQRYQAFLLMFLLVLGAARADGPLVFRDSTTKKQTRSGLTYATATADVTGLPATPSGVTAAASAAYVNTGVIEDITIGGSATSITPGAGTRTINLSGSSTTFPGTIDFTATYGGTTTAEHADGTATATVEAGSPTTDVRTSGTSGGSLDMSGDTAEALSYVRDDGNLSSPNDYTVRMMVRFDYAGTPTNDHSLWHAGNNLANTNGNNTSFFGHLNDGAMWCVYEGNNSTNPVTHNAAFSPVQGQTYELEYNLESQAGGSDFDTWFYIDGVLHSSNTAALAIDTVQPASSKLFIGGSSGSNSQPTGQESRGTSDFFIEGVQIFSTVQHTGSAYTPVGLATEGITETLTSIVSTNYAEGATITIRPETPSRFTLQATNAPDTDQLELVEDWTPTSVHHWIRLQYTGHHWQELNRFPVMLLVVPTTDHGIARFSGEEGQVQNSGVTISDADLLDSPGGISLSGGAFDLNGTTVNDANLIFGDPASNFVIQIGSGRVWALQSSTPANIFTFTDTSGTLSMRAEGTGLIRLRDSDNVVRIDVDNASPHVEVTGDQQITGSLSVGSVGANLPMGSNKITGMAEGVAADDAATVSQVSAAASGIDVKASVRACTVDTLDANADISGSPTYDSDGGTATRGRITATLAVSGDFAIDDVALANDDRVLLKNEGTGTAEVMGVDTVADSTDSLDGTHWIFYTNASKGWYVWYNTPAGGGDPAPSPPAGVSFTGIQVTIIQNETAALVATKTETAIEASAAQVDDVVVGTNDMTITNSFGGDVTNVADGSGTPSGFTIATDTAGVGIGGDANGIYTVTIAGTSLTLDRATDFDEDAEVVNQSYAVCDEGTVNIGIGQILLTANPITIGGAGGTSQTWGRFSFGGSAFAFATDSITATTHSPLAGTATVYDTTSNAITVSAPDCNGTTAGKRLLLKLRTKGTANNVTVNPFAGDTIDGDSSLTLTFEDQAEDLICFDSDNRWERW